MLLPAAIGAPLLAIGLSPVVAYNLLFLSGFLLSGIATYVLIEGLLGSPRGGVRRRVDLRVLPVPLRALQPSRAPDDLLDAAGAAGAAPPVADLAHAVRRRARAVRSGGAVPRRCITACSSRSTPVRSSGRCSSCPVPSGAASVRPLAAAGLIAVVLSVPLARPYYAAARGQRGARHPDGDVLQRDRIRLLPRPPAQCDVRRPAARRRVPGARAVPRRRGAGAIGRRAGAAPRRDPPGLRSPAWLRRSICPEG